MKLLLIDHLMSCCLFTSKYIVCLLKHTCVGEVEGEVGELNAALWNCNVWLAAALHF